MSFQQEHGAWPCAFGPPMICPCTFAPRGLTLQVAAVHLHHEPFSVDNGLMTPTFKLKRPQAQAAFQEVITEMYSRLPNV